MPPSAAVAPDGSCGSLRRSAIALHVGRRLPRCGRGAVLDWRTTAAGHRLPTAAWSLQQLHLAASVLRVVEGRPGPPVEVTDGNGDALAATFVYPAPGRPTCSSTAVRTRTVGTGPSGIGSVLVGRSLGPRARTAGKWVSVGLDAFHDQGFDLVTTASGWRLQPIRLRTVARPAAPAAGRLRRSRPGRAGGGPVVVDRLPWLADARVRWGHRLSGTNDGAPVAPAAGRPGRGRLFQVRHLFGRPGCIHLMLAPERDGHLPGGPSAHLEEPQPDRDGRRQSSSERADRAETLVAGRPRAENGPRA
jgi:hypothetical protein